jgi:hypothetical protein
MTMQSRKIIVAFTIALMSIFVSSELLLAQSSTTGAIIGVVKDQNGNGLPGVTVVAKGSRGKEQTGFTGGNGRFKLTSLPPGMYKVFYFFGGDKPNYVREVQVRLNKTTTSNARFDPSKTGETIVNTAKAPTIDTTSSKQGVTLDKDYTQNIPVPGRTFTSALGAAPGSTGDALGVSFSGSTSLENSYVVDGVNTTSLTYGMSGSRLINDFIEEIEIITGGYNAEYGRVTGGVVNVVTKIGTNEFKGIAFGYVKPGFLIAVCDRTPSETASIDANSNLAYDFDFGFDLGGPIVKDKVFFYVGFSPRIYKTDIEKLTKNRTACRIQKPDGSWDGPAKCLVSDANGVCTQWEANSTNGVINTAEFRGDVPCTDGAADMKYMSGDGSVADVDPNTGFTVYEPIDSQTFHRDGTNFQMVAKLNYQVTPEHQGQISFVGTPQFGQTRGISGDPASHSWDWAAFTSDISAKWNSKFNNNDTEIEAIVGWHRDKYDHDSISDDPRYADSARENYYYGNLGTWSRLGFETNATEGACVDGTATDKYRALENCPGYSYRVGGIGSLADDKEERIASNISITQRMKLVGDHEFKAGMDFENNVTKSTRQYSGGVYYQGYIGNSLTNGDIGQYYAYRFVRLAPPDNPDSFNDECVDDETIFTCEWSKKQVVNGNTFNWSAFVRDSWQPVPNLTFNYGLRYEEQRLRYAENLQDTTDALTGEALGKNAMILSNMLAPRLGVIYDWTKEGKSKIYGHWGRFYESIPMDINERSFGGETTYREVFNAPEDCGEADPDIGAPRATNCAGTPSYGSTVYGSGVKIAPGIQAQYMDEYVFGLEYEIIEDLKFGVSFQNRLIGRVLEDVSVDQADTYILANPGEWSSEEENKLKKRIESAATPEEKAALEADLEMFKKIRTFDTPRRDYKALQLTATKRFSQSFFMQASYTYSRTEGNYPGLFSADNGQVDPNISSQYDLIELLSNRDGPLPQDRPHYFKFDGYYIYDMDKNGTFTTGGRFRALSGVPVDLLGGHYLYGSGESFVLPRGEMGRTDFDWGLDLHLAYGRDLAKGMKLEFFTDLFSVFNNQGTFSVDELYTYDDVNPIVGGDYADMVFAKQQDRNGRQLATPVGRNLNFKNPTARYSPFAARFGMRLTF